MSRSNPNNNSSATHNNLEKNADNTATNIQSNNTPLIVVFAILMFGMTCSALSFIFIRESVERSITLAAWRVLLAALLLAPAYYAARKKYGDEPFIEIIKRSVIPGLFLSFHFITWVSGVRLTPAANATLIVNLMPLVMPFFMYFLYKEKLYKREWIATGLAMIGIVILSISDVQISKVHFTGDIICLVSMVLFSAYLALARSKLESVPSIWLYVVPMYAIAGMSSLIIAAFTGPIMPTLDGYNLLMVFLLAAVSTVIGHSALNFAMQKLRGQTVTLLNMLQFVIAGTAGYLMYGEVPSTLFYVASTFIIAGLLLVVLQPTRAN